MPDLVTRVGKGSPLTTQEMDGNLLLLQSGYPRVTIPLNGTLQKWKCNVLSGSSASTYNWPTEMVLGDKLQIVTAGVNTATNPRRIGNMVLDTISANPVTVECINTVNWTTALSLAGYIGKTFTGLSDYPIALAPLASYGVTAPGVLFTASDNRVVELNGTGNYTMYGPTNASDGRTAQSIRLVSHGKGGVITYNGVQVLELDQDCPQGITLYLKAGAWDFPYPKLSQYTGVQGGNLPIGDPFAIALNTRVYMTGAFTLMSPAPVQPTDVVEFVIGTAAIGGKILVNNDLITVDVAPGQPFRLVQAEAGSWFTGGRLLMSEFFPSGGNTDEAPPIPHPFLMMGA